MALYSGGDEDIFRSTVAAATAALKQRLLQNDVKIIYCKHIEMQLHCRQPEPETGPLWQIGMHIHNLMIFNSASDIQTHHYAAGQTPETLGKKKQRSRAESEEKDDEGCDPDSDQSFTLAALDSQSFMRKTTLRIIPAAISHNGTELPISDIVLPSSLQNTSFISSVAKPGTALSLRFYTKLSLFLEDTTSSVYLNNLFCYIMSKVGEWWVTRCACG